MEESSLGYSDENGGTAERRDNSAAEGREGAFPRATSIEEREAAEAAAAAAERDRTAAAAAAGRAAAEAAAAAVTRVAASAEGGLAARETTAAAAGAAARTEVSFSAETATAADREAASKEEGVEQRVRLKDTGISFSTGEPAAACKQRGRGGGGGEGEAAAAADGAAAESEEEGEVAGGTARGAAGDGKGRIKVRENAAVAAGDAAVALGDGGTAAGEVAATARGAAGYEEGITEATGAAAATKREPAADAAGAGRAARDRGPAEREEVSAGEITAAEPAAVTPSEAAEGRTTRQRAIAASAGEVAREATAAAGEEARARRKGEGTGTTATEEGEARTVPAAAEEVSVSRRDWRPPYVKEEPAAEQVSGAPATAGRREPAITGEEFAASRRLAAAAGGPAAAGDAAVKLLGSLAPPSEVGGQDVQYSRRWTAAAVGGGDAGAAKEGGGGREDSAEDGRAATGSQGVDEATVACVKTEAALLGAALWGGTREAHGTTLAAAAAFDTAAATARAARALEGAPGALGAAAASLESPGLDSQEAATALGNACAAGDAVFDEGDTTAAAAAASLEAAAALAVLPEGEDLGDGETTGAAAGHWAAESTMTNREVAAPWTAPAAGYEVDARGVAGEADAGVAGEADAGGERSDSFVGASQPLEMPDSSSYSSVVGDSTLESSYSSSGSGDVCVSYSSSAEGSDNAAALSGSYTGNESGSSGVSFDCSYSSGDSGAACSSSCVDFSNNYLSTTSSTDVTHGVTGSSSGSVGFVDNYSGSSAKPSGSADGSSSCELSQQLYDEGGAQQLGVYDGFSNSSSGRVGEFSSSQDDGVLGYDGSCVEYNSSAPFTDSNVVYDSSTGGMEVLGEGEGANNSSSMPPEEVPYGDMLPYADANSSSGEYQDSVAFDDGSGSAAAPAVEEAEIEAEIVAEAADSYGSLMDEYAGVGDEENKKKAEGDQEQLEEAEGGQLDVEEEEGREAQEEQPWRGVLGVDDLLTERDDDILKLLAEEEPTVPDELCRYFLHRVGCATADRTVIRLISLAAQLQVERVIDDAKVFAFMQDTTATASVSSVDEATVEADELLSDATNPDEVEDLDIGSLCAALQKNDGSFCGLSLDCFLDAAPVFLQDGGAESSAAVEPEGTAEAAVHPVLQAAYAATAAAPEVSVMEAESETTSELNTLLETRSDPAGAVPYPVSFQSSYATMGQPSSAVAASGGVADPNIALPLATSHPQTLYTAPTHEGYDLQPAVPAVDPAPLAAVDHGGLAFPTVDGVRGASAVLVQDGHLFSAGAPATVDALYSSAGSSVPPDAAATTLTGATYMPHGMAVDVSTDVPVDTTGAMVPAVAAAGGAVDTARDTAAGGAPTGLMPPADVSAPAAPLLDVAGSLRGVASVARAPSAAGVSFDSTLSTSGAFHAFQGIADPTSCAVAGDVSLTSVDVRGAAFTADQGGVASLPAAVGVGAAGGGGDIPAADISAAGGIFVGSTADGSTVVPPIFPSIISAAAQHPPATATIVVSAAVADGVRVSPPTGANQTSAYTALGSAAPPSSTNVGSAIAGSTLFPATFSAATVGSCYDAAPLYSVPVQTAATYAAQPAADFSSQTSTPFPVEPDFTSEPSVVSGASRSLSLEAADSGLQSTDAATRETPAAVEPVSAASQSSKTSADTGVVAEGS